MRSLLRAGATLGLLPPLVMAGCMGGRDCTAMGGLDTVSATLVGADTSRTYFVEACVVDRCATGRTFPGQPAVAGVDAHGLVTSTTKEVRVAVRDTDGVALGQAVTVPASTPHPWYPNGKGCDPSLWRTEVSVDVPPTP